MTVVSVCASEG